MEEEEGNKMSFEGIIESIVNTKLANKEIKKEDLNGLEIGVSDLMDYEEHLNSGVEPFKVADKVKVDEPETSEAVFLKSNIAFVGEVTISSVQLTTKVANMNEMAEEAHFYQPEITPIMKNNSFESVRYILMKVDEDIDKEKAKKGFNDVIENPDKYHTDERYLVVKGSFNTVEAPYSRDTSYKVRIN